MAVSGDSESEATLRASAAWASVSTNRVVMLASDVIQSIWEVDDVSYTGTGTAPADQIAKSSTVHSNRVRHMIPTVSPGPIPRAMRPLATASTYSCASPPVTSIH